MSESLNILKKEFDKLSADLTEKHNELGMRASGNWVQEKIVEASESGTLLTALITAPKYTEQLQYGRKPGKFPPLAAIEQWINDKGITPDIPIRSLAYLIARKIAMEGTEYYKQGGTGLIDSVITSERIDGIISKVGIINVEGIVGGMVKKLKKVSA